MSMPTFPRSSLLTDWAAVIDAGPGMAGGKGWGLACLAASGLPVPPGVVLSAVCHEWSEGECRNQVRAELIERLSVELAEKGWTGCPLAVRSSAVGEDGGQASHAGIFVSCLGICGVEAVVDAVQSVWDSARSPSALAYRARWGLPAEIRMAVVVMPMLTVESAGVAFSADPRDGRHDRVLLHANWGLGRSVVEGLAEPDEYVFDLDLLDERISLRSRQMGRKQLRIASDGSCDSSPAESAAWVLSPSQAHALAGLVLDAARALDFSRPLFDLEWAWDGSQFWLLQARPITALPRHGYDALATQPRWWSSGNARDVVPLPLSALEWSGVRTMVERVSTQYCRRAGMSLLQGIERARLFDGRVYLDLGLAQYEHWAALGIPPVEFNRELGGQQPEIALPPTTPVGLKMKWLRGWLRLMLSLPRVRLRADHLAERVARQAGAMRDGEWPQEKSNVMPFLRAIRRAAFEQDDLCFLQMPGVASTRLRHELVGLLPENGEAVASALLSEGRPTVTAEQGDALLGLARLARSSPVISAWLTAHRNGEPWPEVPEERLKSALQEFTGLYGHRAVYESYLRQPRWHESNAYVLDSLRGLLDADIEQIAERKRVSRKSAIECMRRMSNFSRWKVRLLARMAQQENRQRELARSTLIRLLDAGRQQYLRVGEALCARGLLLRRDDVFELTPGEVELAWDAGISASGLQWRVSWRQRQRADWEAIRMPALFREEADRTEPLAAESTDAAAISWSGMPISAGVASGAARVIRHPESAHALRAGDVLVCASADPAWTLLFLRAKAIVMEVGGYLSHGAIVAREFGIPAVAGVPGIVEMTEEGALLQVDGATGRIIRVSHGADTSSD